MTEQNKKIGARFEYFRKEYLKKNQAEIAKELGTTQKTISYYESGIRFPHPKMLTKMVDKYGLNTDWLFNELGNPILTDEERKTSSESTLVRIEMIEQRLEKMEELIDQLVKIIQK